MSLAILTLLAGFADGCCRRDQRSDRSQTNADNRLPAQSVGSARHLFLGHFFGWAGWLSNFDAHCG